MINWGKLGAVVLSWVISPVFSMVIGFTMFKIIVKTILSKKNSFLRALQLSPFFIGIAIFVIILSFLFKTPLGKKLAVGTPAALIIAAVLAGIVGYSGKRLLRRFLKNPEQAGEEGVFRKIQIGTSC